MKKYNSDYTEGGNYSNKGSEYRNNESDTIEKGRGAKVKQKCCEHTK